MDTSKGTILVVDDDADIRESLADLLAIHGYGVLAAANGAEALQVLAGAEAPPCLMLLDLMMPVVSGHEVLHRMRAHLATSACPPVIVMTAGGDRPAGPPVLRVLPKPFALDEVLGDLRAHCG